MRPLFVFAPGAGASSNSRWMQAWAERLATLGEVERFDYDYMRLGKRRPDRHGVLVKNHRAAIATASARHGGRIVLIGKSMGGRIGCHVSLEEPVDRVVCLGYPLIGMDGDVRDEVLREMTAPILFVQGTRDPMCPLERLEEVRAQMKAPNLLHVVEGGDHSLELTKTERRADPEAQDRLDAAVLAAIGEFVAQRA